MCRNNGRNHKRIQRPVLKRDEAFSVVISFFEIDWFFFLNKKRRNNVWNSATRIQMFPSNRYFFGHILFSCVRLPKKKNLCHCYQTELLTSFFRDRLNWTHIEIIQKYKWNDEKNEKQKYMLKSTKITETNSKRRRSKHIQIAQSPHG